MRAVWSHWTKPLRDHPGSVWLSTRHYLMAFVLSFHTARRHYPVTVLYTDVAGERMLVDFLRLPFDEVHAELDVLDGHCLYWWNLGKFHTYSVQQDPFIHLDNDVFLWEPLPDRVITAPVFAQNPEFFTDDSDYYLPDDLERAVASISDGWLPAEWKWARGLFANCQRSANTGVYGGYRTDFIRYCARLALELIGRPAHEEVFRHLDDKARHTGMIEMFLPSVCADFHRAREDSPFRDVYIEYLFRSAEEASLKAMEMGYTHLIGRAKRDRDVVARLERRVKTDFPEYYDRCIRYVDQFGELYQPSPPAAVALQV